MNMTVENVPLDAEARDSLASLAYTQWANAFNNLKMAKQEKPDGSKDWELFHRDRLDNATSALSHAKRVLDQISKWSPLVR